MGNEINLTRVGIDTLKELYNAYTDNNITQEKITLIEQAAQKDEDYSQGEQKLVQLLKDQLTLNVKSESPLKFINFNPEASKFVANYDLKINTNNIEVYEGNIFGELKTEDLKVGLVDKDGLTTDSKNDINLSVDGKVSASIDFNSILKSAAGFGGIVTALKEPPGIKVELKTLFTPEVLSLRLSGQDKLALHIGKAVQLLGMEDEILKNLANIFKISEKDMISTGDGNYTIDIKKIINNSKKLDINGKNFKINEIIPGNITMDIPNSTTPGFHTINVNLNNTKLQAGTGNAETNESLPDDVISAKINADVRLDETGRNYQTGINVDGNASLRDKSGFDFAVDYQKNGTDIKGDIKINNFDKSIENILKETIEKNSQGKFKADIKVVRDNNGLKLKINGQYGIEADLNIGIKDNKLNVDLGHVKLLKLPALEAPERAEKILKAYLPLNRNKDVISIDINETLNKYLPDSIRNQYKLTNISLTDKGLEIKFNSLKQGEVPPPKPELPPIDFKAGKPNGIHLDAGVMNSAPAITLSYQRDVYKLNVAPLSDPLVRVTAGPVVSLGLGNGEAGHVRAGVGSEARVSLAPVGAPFFIGLGTDLTYGNLGTDGGKVALGLGPTVGYDNGKVTAGIGYKREFVINGKDFNTVTASVGIRF